MPTQEQTDLFNSLLARLDDLAERLNADYFNGLDLDRFGGDGPAVFYDGHNRYDESFKAEAAGLADTINGYWIEDTDAARQLGSGPNKEIPLVLSV